MDDSYWYWWIGSLVFVVLAMLAMPLLLIAGLAAAVMGVVVFFLPNLGWQINLLLFALLCVAAIPLRQHYRKIHPLLTDNPYLNQRSERHVGRVLTLQRPIQGGVGRETINGISWRIEGPDLPAGQQVRVTGADGASLMVETAGAGQQDGSE